MGKKFIPAFTDIVIDFFDVHINNQFKNDIVLYERYQDDINIINEANSFDEHLNKIDDIRNYVDSLTDYIKI